jgi:hypothetical protein
MLKKVGAVLVVLGAGGYMYYLVDNGRLNAADGKFLGFFEDKESFCPGDAAKFAAIVVVPAMLGALAHKMLPGVVGAPPVKANITGAAA